MIIRTLTLIAFALLTVAGSESEHRRPNPIPTESEEDRLADEVDDPTAILKQLKFQDLYTPRNFQTSAQTKQIDLKVVLPLKPFWLLPFEQIMRPTLKVQTIAASQSSSSTITEFADKQLFDLCVSNWPDPSRTGLGWGIGPTFVFPTGRVLKAGQHASQAGSAAAAAYLRALSRLAGGSDPRGIELSDANSRSATLDAEQFRTFINRRGPLAGTLQGHYSTRDLNFVALNVDWKL